MLGLQEKRWEEMEKRNMPLAQAMEDYASDLRILRRSAKTISFYLRNLNAFLKWLKRHSYQCVLGDLNLPTVKRYVLYLEEEHQKFKGHPYTPQRDERLSLFSVQGHVRTLKALASWLYREEYLSENILARLRLPKAPKTDIKVLTDDEIKTLLSAINPNASSGARNYTILLLMLDSGLRLGEVVGLKLTKTDIERGQL